MNKLETRITEVKTGLCKIAKEIHRDTKKKFKDKRHIGSRTEVYTGHLNQIMNCIGKVDSFECVKMMIGYCEQQMQNMNPNSYPNMGDMKTLYTKVTQLKKKL